MLRKRGRQPKVRQEAVKRRKNVSKDDLEKSVILENNLVWEEMNDNATSSSSMIPKFTRAGLQQACEHIKSVDPVLAPLLIAQGGPPESLLPKEGSTFASLSKSICYQQLATKAAAKIFQRVLALDSSCAASGSLSPEVILQISLEDLRSAGLSQRKAEYIRDLALHYDRGVISCDMIRQMNLDQIYSSLTAVKGIGPWTVDMFLLFHYGATDCLPTSDLGIRKGMQKLYSLKHLPSVSEMEKIAEKWKPFRSLGAYMMWRVPST